MVQKFPPCTPIDLVAAKPPRGCYRPVPSEQKPPVKAGAGVKAAMKDSYEQWMVD